MHSYIKYAYVMHSYTGYAYVIIIPLLVLCLMMSQVLNGPRMITLQETGPLQENDGESYEYPKNEFYRNIWANEHVKYNRNFTIFYNRVPKCGSSTLLSVFAGNSWRNNFTYIMWQVFSHIRPSLENQKKFVEDWQTNDSPMILDRHLHFIDFTKFGYSNPIYINVIRDPVERLNSWYYFRRFQKGHIRKMSTEDRNRTFEDCVDKLHPECTQAKGDQYEEGWFKIIPYFCGQEPFCVHPTERALIKAISNVKKHYSLVGVTEDLHSFLQRLELFYPQVFHGIYKLLKENENKLLQIHKTVKKKEISLRVSRKMREIMKIEYEFYNFIIKRFQWNLQKT